MIVVGIFLVISLFLGIILTLNLNDKKVWSSVLYSLFLVFLVACFLEIKGTPKKLNHEWRNLEENTVVATYEVEPIAIYVWLLRVDSREPIAYTLPWSIEVAENLRKTREKAERNSATITLNTENGKKNNNNDALSNDAFSERMPRQVDTKR